MKVFFTFILQANEKIRVKFTKLTLIYLGYIFLTLIKAIIFQIDYVFQKF